VASGERRSPGSHRGGEVLAEVPSTVRVAFDPAWAPVEFLDKHGIPQGISADYLLKIGEILGVRFEIAKGMAWPELVGAVQRRDLDMFSSFFRTPEREAYVGFTAPYLSLPIGIFNRRMPRTSAPWTNWREKRSRWSGDMGPNTCWAAGIDP